MRQIPLASEMHVALKRGHKFRTMDGKENVIVMQSQKNRKCLIRITDITYYISTFPLQWRTLILFPS